MTDIVDWLRAYANRTTVIDIKRLDEAADEIERLRADADFNYMHGYESAKSDYRDLLLESEADATIEKLRAALVKAREQMKWLAEHEQECLGVVPMDDGSEVPAIWIAIANIDAALNNNQ